MRANCVGKYLQNRSNRWFSQHSSLLVLQIGSESQGEDPFQIWKGVQKTPIDKTISSSDVADEEQTFFTQTEDDDETEEQTLNGKNTPEKRQQSG